MPQSDRAPDDERRVADGVDQVRFNQALWVTNAPWCNTETQHALRAAIAAGRHPPALLRKPSEADKITAGSTHTNPLRLYPAVTTAGIERLRSDDLPAFSNPHRRRDVQLLSIEALRRTLNEPPDRSRAKALEMRSKRND
jgi:hypothetical protein